MDSKREQALVGLFVLIAVAILSVTVFYLSGPLGASNISYKTYFKNAGGLAPGAEVSYAGGPSIGRVNNVQSDPQNPTRMEIDFSVQPGVPVKTDSTAIITSTSPLGDNFLGIVPGSVNAPPAPSGSVLPSTEYVSLSDVMGLIGNLGPNADNLVKDLDDRTAQIKITLDRVNDLLDTQNRANISTSLANVRGMLEEDRPGIHSAINNLDDTTAKLGPLVDNFQKAATQANQTLADVDATIGEDRPDLHQAIASLRQALGSAATLTDQLNSTLNANTENIDEILDNMRRVTENLNSFTETIKTRPYTLIRSSGVKPRTPGEQTPP